ncbi:immunoglobulin-like domain-containing protein [Clostridium sp. SM-530-WT-3G]|uniref:immunoglobulin-like domain-containing protein n=1 Tax=Clostridium sp. SM-530-WT-3G TaxID=2725303 RepID=UPI00145D7DF6|nr:immunoglobulin-like domain-containing protein [Clostridium sp. SM-530-WT-3G]NME84391.1 hypothetical protein [Clostridium sp. SM-530-WT-3G]
MSKNKLALGVALIMGMTTITTIKPEAAVYNGGEKYGSKWYYYDKGIMKTGWLNSGTNWYYLKDDGAMASGWCYLDSDGVMKEGITDIYILKKYYFNKNGEWVEDTNDLFKLSTSEKVFSTDSKSIDVCIINRTDHDYEVKADENYLQKLRNDGLWEIVNLKNGSRKIGNKIVRAHSSENYSIDVSTLAGGKLEPGQYKIYNYLGNKYYEYEFEVKNQEPISLKTKQKVYKSDAGLNVEYIIINNTDSEAGYGKDYSIEKKVNGKWKHISLKDENFIEISILLEAHKTDMGKFSISNIDEEKPMGEYRLVKKINGKDYYANFILE